MSGTTLRSNLATRAPAEQWADRIRTQISKSVAAIIETGCLLVKAKNDLPHGEWGRMFDDGLLPFSHQTANKLMAVFSNTVLSNPAHVRILPPSWGTLYELSKADDVTLNNAIKDGVITPDMPRKAVAALLPAKTTQEPEPFHCVNGMDILEGHADVHRDQGAHPSSEAAAHHEDEEALREHKRILASWRRADRSNRIIARTAETAENVMAAVDMVDFAALDERFVAEWANSIRTGARELQRLADRLEREADRRELERTR